MAEQGKGLALVVLGIVAVIAVVGMVLLFSKAGATGKYVYEAGYAQFNPNEVCEQRVGCPLKAVEGGIYYSSSGPLMAICGCPWGEVETPLTRPFDWREEYYPSG
jgi:hypothetical protein